MIPRLHVVEQASDDNLNIIYDLIAFKKTLMVLVKEYRIHNPALALIKDIDISQQPDEHKMESVALKTLLRHVRKREPFYDDIVILSQNAEHHLLQIETAIRFINIDTDEYPEERATLIERENIIAINTRYLLNAARGSCDAAIKFLNSNLGLIDSFSVFDLLGLYSKNRSDPAFLKHLFLSNAIPTSLQLPELIREVRQQLSATDFDKFAMSIKSDNCLYGIYLHQGGKPPLLNASTKQEKIKSATAAPASQSAARLFTQAGASEELQKQPPSKNNAASSVTLLHRKIDHQS